MRNTRMHGGYSTYCSLDADGNIVAKACTFCGELKKIDLFAKNGKNADGTCRYRDDCKTCYNIRRRENTAKKKHSDFIGSMKRRGEVEVSYTHQQWKETVIFFGGECAYCGCTPRKGERLTRDHLMPVRDGGATTQENIVPACGSCNSSKGASEWREWFMKQSFFSQERMNRIFKWRSIMRTIGGEENEDRLD